MGPTPGGAFTTSSTTPWYCVHTKRAKEDWVARQLAGVCDEVYLPLLRQWRKVRRQFVWKVEPLFPGYVFARFAIEERFRSVRYTPGVAKVLSTALGEPIAVNDTIISALRRRSVDGYIQVSSAPFSPSEELEITEGPFRGLRVLFQQELKAGERVVVLLQLLSSRVRVELPRAYVRKTASGSYERHAV
ncbi:MAG TPA: transcription termination/antitermination NusG family protein [Candidatus Binatia bacterium]|nr:transcription termination/antitermination NusG family protein [Candidatus Binatia bacterium]